MANDNYLKKLARVLRSVRLPQGTVTQVWIYHDEWCAVLRGSRCNCDPILKVCRATSAAPSQSQRVCIITPLEEDRG